MNKITNYFKNNKSRTVELIVAGIVIGFACGLPIGLGVLSGVAKEFKTLIIVIITALILISVFIALIYIFRDKIFSWFNLTLTQKPKIVSQNISAFISAIKGNDLERIKETSHSSFQILFNLYLWYKLRQWSFGLLIGLVVAFTGLAGSALIYHQNEILEAQEKYLEEQTNQLKAQTVWFEKEISSVEIQVVEATRASLFSHALEIQRILIDNPDLVEYFYEGKNHKECTDKKLVKKITIVSEMFADMIDHAASCKPSDIKKEGWDEYANDMYNSSPAFKEFVNKYEDWYPSLAKWIEFD